MQNKETTLEKVKALLDKLSIEQAIEVYHTLGEMLHARINTQKAVAEQQLQSLNKK